MPLYTVKEIGTICGIEHKNVHTYICRGKLIKRKDGLIDDSNKLNQEFLIKYDKTGKFKNNIIEPVITVPVKEVVISDKQETKEEPVKAKRKPKKKTRVRVNNDYNEDDLGNYVTSRELNILKAEELREKIKALQLKNKKQSGELIPLEQAKIIFNIHITNITQAFYNTMDNYTADLCNKLDVSRNVLSEFRGKLKKTINEATQSAKKHSENDLLNLSEKDEDEE